MKPNDVTSDSYAECNDDSNEKDSKIKVAVHVGFWGMSSNYGGQKFFWCQISYKHGMQRKKIFSHFDS